MNLTEAATVLQVSARTLRLAVERGELAAQHPLPDGPWVFRRDALTTPMADKLVERVRQSRRHAAIPPTQQDTLTFSGT
jgi:Helix-turn-helix domain